MEEILLKLANDSDVPLIAKGLFLEMAYASAPDPTIEENLDMMNLLLDLAYLDHDGDKYFIPGHQEGDEDLKMAWKAFYTEYPGRKLGVNKEFDLFKAKYKNGKWRKLLPDLPDHLQRQITEREAYQHAMDMQNAKGNKNHQMFLPGWRNMKTYINQAAWEEQYLVPAQFTNEEAAAPAPTMREGSPYERYFKWALEEATAFRLESIMPQLVLTETDFNEILTAQHPDFSGYPKYMTTRALAEVLKEAQMDYFKTVSLRSLYPKFINYLKWAYQRAKG